jgi:hypothetical protein
VDDVAQGDGVDVRAWAISAIVRADQSVVIAARK